MRPRTALALRSFGVGLIGAALSGCVTTAAMKPLSPRGAPGSIPPSIALVELQPIDVQRQERAFFTKGLQSALANNPFMSKAAVNPTEDVHFIFALQPSVSRSSFWVLALLTVGLMPAPSTDVLRVTLTVYEPATGRDLLTVQAERRRRTVIWLPAIIVLPFNLAFRDHDPAAEVYDSVFAQAEDALSGRPLPPAVPAVDLPRRSEIAPVPLPRQ